MSVILANSSNVYTVKEEKENGTNGDADIVLPKEEEVEGEGLVFDDTSEFVRSIVYDPESEKKTVVKLPVRKEDLDGDESPGSDRESPEAGEIDVKEEENEQAALFAMQMDVDANGNVEMKAEDDAVVSFDILKFRVYLLISNSLELLLNNRWDEAWATL
jgi:U4/U6.U5 tri-snRNP-associated protein 1